MRIAKIKEQSIENGPGLRTSVFVSGCRNGCPGCFNREAWDFAYGEPFTENVKERILATLDYPYLDGITILGGEPMEPENQKEVLELIMAVKEKYPNKTVWLYSGCCLEDLLDENFRTYTEYTVPILSAIDVLVDGPFIEAKKDIKLVNRGSSNQRVINMKQHMKEKEETKK